MSGGFGHVSALNRSTLLFHSWRRDTVKSKYSTEPCAHIEALDEFNALKKPAKDLCLTNWENTFRTSYEDPY